MISRDGIKVAMTTTGSVTPGFEELRKPYVYGGDKPHVEAGPERKRAATAGGAALASEKAERFRQFCEHRDADVGVFEAGARVGVKQRAARRYERERLAATGEARDA